MIPRPEGCVLVRSHGQLSLIPSDLYEDLVAAGTRNFEVRSTTPVSQTA
jgi:hypothetical protein